MKIDQINMLLVVPEAGLEPARYFYRGILSPLCLPIPPLGLINFVSFNILNISLTEKLEAEAGIEPA